MNNTKMRMGEVGSVCAVLERCCRVGCCTWTSYRAEVCTCTRVTLLSVHACMLGAVTPSV
jgi:hypothetical protein